MALKVTPALEIAGVEFDHLHLRTGVESAPETNAAPFSITRKLRYYFVQTDENGDPVLDKDGNKKKLFAAEDQGSAFISLREDNIEEFIASLVAQGKIEKAQIMQQGFYWYEKCIAVQLEEMYPGITVEVV